ncbi:sulfatase family protein [Modicisalibacter radicis]|uniref:sulfatase family protein n=1 Tax=Halomonas sp. EAR18 TaxID=2518972 RepID=UPI0014448C2E|nr:sulfatase [Halomonas sp. EAR18]
MTQSDGTRPDVVLIHCHDLGRWLSCYGMPSVPSPNLERFARDATVFDNAHAAAPLCSPARGALFTGLSPHQNGIQGLAHDAWRYRENVLTAPEHLRALGYRSTLIGLQHEHVDPDVLGYDEVAGAGFLPRAHQVVDAARGWLAGQAPRDTRAPLFAAIGVWEVHRPWPESDYTPADPAEVEVPDFLPDTPATRRDIAAFHGSIRQLDEAMGRLFEALDSHLDPANTLIIFTTDHGPAFPRAKSTLYDAGTGVSLLVRPPTAWGEAPARVDSIASHVDILPTLLEVAGGPADPSLEGRSLAPLFTAAKSKAADDRMIFTEKTYHDNYDPKRAVRTRDFALIRNFTPGPKLALSLDLEHSPTRQGMGDAHLEARDMTELYDRRVDPHELNNVFDQPEYQNIRTRLLKALDEWMLTTRDPLLEGPIHPPKHRTRAMDALPPLPANTDTSMSGVSS